MNPQIVRATTRMEHWSGPFRIWRSYPGRFLAQNKDPGLGPLGCVDHASLMPGLTVPMHVHENDEIFSYLREGILIHTDTVGKELTLDPQHPLMMNSGRGLSHEEHIPVDGAPVRMLQIFVRPPTVDLPPMIQHFPLDENESVNAWRLLAGPEEGEGLFHFRNQVWFFDLTLENATLPLPPAKEGLLRWLYVFNGRVQFAEGTLNTGDALILDSAEGWTVSATERSQIVCFHCDLKAPYTRLGSLSG